ncbi:MAG: glycosyltransferase [Epsilonproteobacteria bacterium]|nr:glycosyltransferase [Campylobacterota bacterium]
MTDTIPFDKNYSTTRMAIKADPAVIANEVKQSSNSEDKLKTVLFLPIGEGRKGEGGLRTKGYFKKSYEDKPLISIITVVCNGEKYLEETIRSVINQTYDNVEYIIIDGGSTDGTLDIIRKYEDAIDYWVSEKDDGIYDAMNKGIDVASGEWLNFMNAGDGFFAKNTIEEIEWGNLDADLVIGDTWLIKENKLLRKIINPYELYIRNKICHQSTFIKRSLQEVFDLEYPILADYKMWLDLFFKRSVKYYFAHFPIALYLTGGISNKSNKAEELKLKKEFSQIAYLLTVCKFQIKAWLNV